MYVCAEYSCGGYFCKLSLVSCLLHMHLVPTSPLLAVHTWLTGSSLEHLNLSQSPCSEASNVSLSPAQFARNFGVLE